jgi:hypothetical protein
MSSSPCEQDRRDGAFEPSVETRGKGAKAPFMLAAALFRRVDPPLEIHEGAAIEQAGLYLAGHVRATQQPSFARDASGKRCSMHGGGSLEPLAQRPQRRQ